MVLAAAGNVLAGPVANPQFGVIYKADAGGNVLYQDGAPVTGTLTAGSYTEGLSWVAVPDEPGTIDIPTLGTWSTMVCTDSTQYSNGQTSGAPQPPPYLLVPGWVEGTPGYKGVQAAGPGMFSTGQTTFLYVNGPGFGGPAGGNVVYQDLGPASVVLTPDTHYLFSAEVGARGDHGYSLAGPIVAGLFVGAAPSVVYRNGLTDWTLPAELPETSASTDLPAAGAFVAWTKTYTTGSSIPAGDVYLILGTAADAPVTGDQVDFTNVQDDLAAEPLPEPGTLALVLVGLGLGCLRRPGGRRASTGAQNKSKRGGFVFPAMSGLD
jgi:hypothetical protein